MVEPVCACSLGAQTSEGEHADNSYLDSSKAVGCAGPSVEKKSYELGATVCPLDLFPLAYTLSVDASCSAP